LGSLWHNALKSPKNSSESVSCVGLIGMEGREETLTRGGLETFLSIPSSPRGRVIYDGL